MATAEGVEKPAVMPGRLEELFKKAEIKAGAVDLQNTPLGKLRDTNSYQFHSPGHIFF